MFKNTRLEAFGFLLVLNLGILFLHWYFYSSQRIMAFMFFILIFSLLIRVVADLCFKATVHDLNVTSLSGFFREFGSFFKRLSFLLALFCGVLMLISWSIVLQHYELSFAYPLFSLSYVVIMGAGAFLYQEKLDRYKLSGMFFILIGVCFLLLGAG